MSLAVGGIIVALMKYKVGDIVLVRSSSGKAIPNFHVKLLKKIKRNTSYDSSYIVWKACLTKRKEADMLRKQWQIPFKFPDEVETFVYETNIIKLIKSNG